MSGNGKVIGGIVAFVVVGALIACGVLIGSSIGTLQSDEVALIYNKVTRILNPKPYYEGLHFGSPGFEFIKFSSVFRTFTFDSLRCLNKDGVDIRLSISYQYRVKPSSLHYIVSEFKDFSGYEDILRVVGGSAIHDACSLFNTSQFQAERGIFQEAVKTAVVKKYNEISTEVTNIQVNNIVRPSNYENSVQNKEAAREAIEVARSERDKGVTTADTKRKTAEAEAVIKHELAESNARVVLGKAKAQAEAILNEFKTEANTFQDIQNRLGITGEDFLNYMNIRTIGKTKQTVLVNMNSPAKTSYLAP